jgi:hypothetical protein
MAKKKSKVDLIEKTLDGEIETVTTEGSTSSVSTESPKVEHSDDVMAASASPSAAKKSRSFKLQFFGRVFVEERFPKSVHFADRFAQEWVSEGSFEFLEIPNPRAKEAILLGLKNIRAVEKTVEKKVEETYSEYSVKLAPYAKRATEHVEKILTQLRG